MAPAADDTQDGQSHPQASPTTATTTTTTTTTSGPHTTTSTTHISPGQGTTLHHDGPTSTTVTHPAVTTTTHMPSLQPSDAQQHPPQAPSYPLRLRSSSIRIRRPSHQPIANDPQEADAAPAAAPSPIPVVENTWEAGRRRSSSEPRPPPQAMFNDDGIRRQSTITPHMQPLYEDGAQETSSVPGNSPRPAQSLGNMRRALTRNSSAFHMRRNSKIPNQNMMGENVVDVLDVIDPEISALTTLNNVQNSLFLPNLPWLYNRQPTYELGQSSSDSSDEEMGTARGAIQEEEMRQIGHGEGAEGASRAGDGHSQRRNSIDSVLSTLEEGPDHHYAVLPHGASLTGWTDEEKAALDDHVRHLLHSRRAKFKRTMKGFGRYVRNPLGFIVTLYFFLITFWGAAWALFLIGWIYVGSRQDYFVEICDQILTALFCVVGITMFPFRLVDTYHMAFVAKYAHKTWRVRKERGLKKLKDHNELPASSAWETGEVEQEGVEAPVLTAEEQKKLEYHQAKLQKSHTFYRPHETYTHHAFSIRLLITIIVLLDCHSMFQCALGGTTWGIYYKDRPKEVTAIILTCSLTCNISAGIIIGQGDRRSRKKLVVEQMLRQEMTEEALKKLKKERGIKAQGLMTKKQKKKMQKDMGEQPKNPLDTILHRG